MEESVFLWATGIIVAILGIVIAVIIWGFTSVSRSISAIKLDTEQILRDIQSARGGFTSVSPNLFFTALAKEARFWEKLSIQRADKIAIARTIATNYIKKGEVVIIDSGTTVDQVPHILHEKRLRMTIYTNNLLAAISIVPPMEGFNCFLLTGKVDPVYGATYNIGDIEGPLRPIKAKKIILAATAISFEGGPMVDALDDSNRLFKKELVRKALEDKESPELIIAVDWSKFSRDDEKKRKAVLEPEVWNDVKNTNRFVMVITKPAGDLNTHKAIRAREEIDLFNTNAEEGGMRVATCQM